MGALVDFSYDELNRITGKSSPQDASINSPYSYDAGRIEQRHVFWQRPFDHP
jgi:hypothetical protein